MRQRIGDGGRRLRLCHAVGPPRAQRTSFGVLPAHHRALLLLGAITAVQNGTLSGLEAFRRLSVWLMLTSIVTAFLTVVGVIINGLEGAIWASLCGGILGFIVLQFVVNDECRRSGIHATYWIHSTERVLWTFALPSFLAGITVMPPIWLANVILVHGPNGYAEMGLFSCQSVANVVVISAECSERSAITHHDAITS